MLHHVGVPKDYVDAAPKGYDDHMDYHEFPHGETWRDVLDIEAAEVYRKGVADARKAEH